MDHNPAGGVGGDGGDGAAGGGGAREYLVCSCYFSNNIFLHDYKLHVCYHTDKQFIDDYREFLKSRGCENQVQFGEVLQNMKLEVEQRKNGGKKHVERSLLIKKLYRKLHPSVYILSENYFKPEFLRAVTYSKSDHATPEGLVNLMQEDVPNAFSLPVFTGEFCSKLMEEIENFEQSDLPKGRPNTMNRGGILLSEMGFDDNFMDPLRRDFLMSLAQLLYPNWVGKGLDSHRAFIVKYTMEDDVELSYHYDNAEVTLNVCLGRSFKGGDLYFGPMRTERAACEKLHLFKNSVGRGLIHRGQHMHGAHPITSGERYNLIIWMRSSSVRNRLCPMCNRPPILVSNMGYGDGFTNESASQCNLT